MIKVIIFYLAIGLFAGAAGGAIYLNTKDIILKYKENKEKKNKLILNKQNYDKTSNIK
ncbi:MAG: hypothetical protein WC390_07245 [Sulfurimonas sp.]|jgi:hypothetical protein